MKQASKLLAAGTMLAAVAVVACEDGRAPENRTHIKIANPHSDQLAALPDELQRLGLMRAIRDSGRRCRRVEAGRYQQDYRDLAMWVALCNDGRYWAIFIAGNADIQVRECAHMRELDLPQCRPLTPPPLDPLRNAR